MCEAIENTSRRNQRIARAAAEYAYSHRGWTYSDLYEAYARPSREKWEAWHYCEKLCAEMGGYDLIISSRNTFQFAVVFSFDDEETGDLCYAYITRDYDRFCYASNLRVTAKTEAAA